MNVPAASKGGHIALLLLRFAFRLCSSAPFRRCFFTSQHAVVDETQGA